MERRQVARDQETSKERTFSLVFELEQVGGVKYGLPRMLALLDQYKIRATFFVTDLINTV